jgi:hypothetical protein
MGKLQRRRLMTYTAPFERVYSHYPLKKGKFQAQKTWTKMYAELPNEDVLIKAIKDQKTERAFLERSNRFAPPWKHFSTWLNSGCWTDECELPLRAVKAIQNTPGNGVDTMMRAYNILCNIGEPEFKDYCKQTKMPPGDVEAVIFKSRGKYDVSRLVGGIG